MSNDLVPAGGGEIVPATTGGEAVGDHVGDMSVDRGRAPSAVTNSGLMRDLQSAVGFDITPEQLQKAREVFARHRIGEDQRQKIAAMETLQSRTEWGASYEQRIRRIVAWLETLPGGLGEEILCARDQAGDVICSKPAVLRAMYEVAAATTLVSDDQRNKAACERALQAEWKGAYHSHIVTVRRYLDTVPRSIREGLLNARDDNDVATLNDPKALMWLLQLARPRISDTPRGGTAPDVSAIKGARLRELEGWMSNSDPRYWKDEAVQSEYRELLDQGARADLVSHTADTDIERRIAEIEKWMGARKGSSEYRRYWDDTAVQREFRELLERRGRARNRS